ncbi:hypothetical protein HNP33_000025 [Comamonas odontotermitis]|uniref:DUF3025 domain-containing protein n=1 Tax=Comamonas odontotermitis TaxID=379895 RepID=A0ABR6RA03_9BURK|nr:hypothetical protein [Comamonas odontotermitis]
MQSIWSALDWSAPWLAPYRGLASRVQMLSANPENRVADVLNQVGDCGRRFVPQTDLPDGEAYEAYIARTGCVPTREHLHDALNGLVWQRFPRTKARLNAWQAQAIAQQGVGAQRGALRDALTLFDENGAVLLAPEPLWQALQARQWRRLFVELRPLWCDAQLVLTGHALLEKLTQPRKPITAHVFCHPFAAGLGDNIDTAIAQALDAAPLATKPFTPLPVLGVPGWSQESENFSFYDDSCVFRAARLPKP